MNKMMQEMTFCPVFLVYCRITMREKNTFPPPHKSGIAEVLKIIFFLRSVPL